MAEGGPDRIVTVFHLPHRDWKRQIPLIGTLSSLKPLIPKLFPPWGLLYTTIQQVSMGDDSEQSGRDVTAVIDERGRLTIKESDRKALGIHGERALLDMNVSVLEISPQKKRTDGGERRD